MVRRNHLPVLVSWKLTDDLMLLPICLLTFLGAITRVLASSTEQEFGNTIEGWTAALIASRGC